MHRLPRRISEVLGEISTPGRPAARLLDCVSALLEAQSACADLERSLAAYREAARGLGIIGEARSGERVYDAWAKLSRYFFEPVAKQGSALCDGDTADAPPGFESLGSLWERIASEFHNLREDEKALDRLLGELPVGAHIGYGVRSRILLLDRRAERVLVALGLLERDLAEASRRGLEAAKRELGQSGSSSGPGGSP